MLPFKLLLTYIQVLVGMGRTFRVALPPLVLHYFDLLAYLQFLDVISIALHFGCLFGVRLRAEPSYLILLPFYPILWLASYPIP